MTEWFLDLRGVFSPPLLITDQTTSELSVTGNDRSIEYYFASDARYKNPLRGNINKCFLMRFDFNLMLFL